MRETLKVGDRVRRKKDYRTFSWERHCGLMGHKVDDIFNISSCLEDGYIRLHHFGRVAFNSEYFEKINKKCVML